MGRSTRVKTNAMKLCYLTVVKNKLFYYTFISKVPVSSLVTLSQKQNYI